MGAMLESGYVWEAGETLEKTAGLNRCEVMKTGHSTGWRAEPWNWPVLAPGPISKTLLPAHETA